jgi:tetratricopeptide (TPR) repeat protein
MKQHGTSKPQPAPSETDAESIWGKSAAMMTTLLVVVVVVAFFPCLRNDFVAWDDDINFLNNPFYRGLGWSQIRWHWTSFQAAVYQPLAWMLLGAEYILFGLAPWGYHLTSLILYALNTALLFVLTLALLIRGRPDSSKQPPGALVLAAGLSVALFAVHPLRTEVVAWASCQPYLPCAFFLVLTVLAYLQAFPDGAAPRWGWLAAAFGLFVAALLAKAVAVSLPAVLLILDVYPLRRLGGGQGRWFGPAVRAVWWEKVPFAVMSLIFMGLAVFGRIQDHHLVPLERSGIAARLAQASYAIVFYPLKTVLPWNIIAYYPMPQTVVWYELPFLASIAGTIAVSVALFLLRRRWPGLLAAWLSYLVILTPNTGVVTISSQIAADRYSYIAMFGFVAVAAAGIAPMLQAMRRDWTAATLCTAASLGVLCGLIVLTWDQCRVWRTTEGLWTHALSHGADGSSRAHHSLALVLEKQARLVDAQTEIARSLQLDPTFVLAHLSQAEIWERQGRLAEAQAEYDRTVQLAPTFIAAHLNRGVLLEKQGRLAEAQAEYAASLQLDSAFAPAHVNQGMLFERQGRILDAEAEYRESIRLDPAFSAAHNNLGAVLEKQGLLAEAQAQYSAILKLNPADAAAHTNLGAVLAKQGRVEEARAEFAESVRLDPRFTLARNNLAAVLEMQGRIGETQAVVAEGVRLDPGNVALHQSLARLLLRQGQFVEAQAHLAEVARLRPTDVAAHQARAWLWATSPEAKLRDGRQAVAAATRACELTGWKDAVTLATLAAAYAEDGNFAQAVTAQNRAIEQVRDEPRRLPLPAQALRGRAAVP